MSAHELRRPYKKSAHLPLRSPLPFFVSAHELRCPCKQPAISNQHAAKSLSSARHNSAVTPNSIPVALLPPPSPSNTEIPLLTTRFPQQFSDPIEVEIDESGSRIDHQSVEEVVDVGGSASTAPRDITYVREASKLRGKEARRWFARQLMLPEWMIDVPNRLSHD